MTLYSYVVEHDKGFSPNPYWGYCTLAHCKSSEGKKNKRRNIVDLAQKGDWIIGTGGARCDRSAGHKRLIYAMRVQEILSLAKYFADKRFEKKKPIPNGPYKKQRGDNRGCDRLNHKGRVLISRHFLYFGRDAIPIPRKYIENKKHPLEKKGPSYRCKFDAEFVEDVVQWLEKRIRKDGLGKHGEPCWKDQTFAKSRGSEKTCMSSC